LIRKSVKGTEFCQGYGNWARGTNCIKGVVIWHITTNFLIQFQGIDFLRRNGT